MSRNRQNHAQFQEPEGLKKIYTPSFSRSRQFIEFLLGQYWVFMLLVDDRGKKE